MPGNSVLSKEGLEYYDGKSKERFDTELKKKVDIVSGKGLSTNDYTTVEKNKLAGISAGANKTIVDSELSSSSTNPVQNKVVNDALSGKANSSHTHTKSDVGLDNVDNTADANKSVKYATSAETATNATKVNNHTVEADVPANAKFTDTTYSNFVKSGSYAKQGLVPAPSTTAGTTKYLREDGTWQIPPNTNTWTAFKGATSTSDGTAGYVPAPTKGDQTKFFRADGTWQTVLSGGNKTAYQVSEPTDQSSNDEWLEEY